MQNNKTRGIWYSGLVLLLISGFIALIIAAVNGVTSPIIKKQTEESIKQSINLIFEGNASYEDITATMNVNSAPDGVMAIYKIHSGNSGEDSYCILSKAAGYGGDIELLVGFSSDGVIAGVKVISASGETPGIGQLVMTDERFLESFGGLKYDANGTKIDGISGATVSSTAVVKAVNNACLTMKDLLGSDKEGSQ